MSTLDDISRSFRDLYQKLSASGRRTAAVTRLRMELAGLSRQRSELFARLGEKLNELRSTGQITDAGLVAILENDFEGIERIGRKIQETMDLIQELNLQEGEAEVDGDMHYDEKISENPENLLDSFDVM